MTPFPELPTVDITEEVAARRALRAWLAAQPDIFAMGGTLHRWDAAADGGRGRLRALDADTLTDYAADRLNTVKRDHSVLLPGRMAKALLRTGGAGYREVESVERWPVVRPDGTICDTPGYDAATRRIVAPAAPVKPVPERPTAEQTEAARAFLVDHMWGSFPFVSDADRAGTLGLYVTPLLRGYLGGLRGAVPATLVTASTPGSGKSYIGQIGLSALYESIELDAGGQTGREAQKSVVAAVERFPSASVLSMDNWKTGAPVGGEFMARLITSPTTEGRLIGTGKFVSVPNDRMVVISGNNIKTADDLARRSVFIRLAPDATNPEEVRHPFDYETEITERAGEVVHALLTLIRAWVVAGAPRREIRLGNFSVWASAVAGLCDVAGVPGFLQDRTATLEAMDDTGADYGRFLGVVHSHTGGSWFRCSEILAKKGVHDLIPRESGREDSKIGHRSLGRRTLRPIIGRVFKDPVSGARLTVRETWNRHDKAFRYAVVDVLAEKAQRAAGMACVRAALVRSKLRAAGRRAALAVKVDAWRRLRDQIAPTPAAPVGPEPEPEGARGVRVEAAGFAAALAALEAMRPATP